MRADKPIAVSDLADCSILHESISQTAPDRLYRHVSSDTVIVLPDSAAMQFLVFFVDMQHITLCGQIEEIHNIYSRVAKEYS